MAFPKIPVAHIQTSALKHQRNLLEHQKSRKEWIIQVKTLVLSTKREAWWYSEYLCVICFSPMPSILLEGWCDAVNQSLLSDLDVILLFQAFSSFSEHLHVAFWALGAPWGSAAQHSHPGGQCPNPKPQTPPTSWSLALAPVTPTSLAWHLGHGGGFAWCHPEPVWVLLSSPSNVSTSSGFFSNVWWSFLGCWWESSTALRWSQGILVKTSLVWCSAQWHWGVVDSPCISFLASMLIAFWILYSLFFFLFWLKMLYQHHFYHLRVTILI